MSRSLVVMVVVIVLANLLYAFVKDVRESWARQQQATPATVHIKLRSDRPIDEQLSRPIDELIKESKIKDNK
jgi:cell division protein FtsX